MIRYAVPPQPEPEKPEPLQQPAPEPTKPAETKEED